MFGEHLHHEGWVFGEDRIHKAVVMMEGFDHLNVGLMTLKGWSANGASMQAGRFTGQCVRIGTGNTITKTLPSNYATLVAGLAIDPIGTLASGTDFFSLRAGATATARLSFNASKQIQVRNSGGSVIATGTTVLVAGVWYFVEFKVFISGASGTCQVKLNGVAEIASTVGNFGSSNLDTVALGANNNVVTDFDDIYVLDTSGAAPRNDFLGDTRIVWLKPSSDGAHTDWTPSSGSNHFDRLNESSVTFPDGDTTYVSDATAGHLDSYGFDDVDSGATVYAIQRSIYARKDDAGTRQIAPTSRQSSTDYVGSTVTLSSSYAFYTDIMQQDPTGADWTAANVNGDEFGIKTIA